MFVNDKPAADQTLVELDAFTVQMPVVTTSIPLVIQVLDLDGKPKPNQYLQPVLVRAPASIYGDVYVVDNCDPYVCKDHDGTMKPIILPDPTQPDKEKEEFQKATGFSSCAEMKGLGPCPEMCGSMPCAFVCGSTCSGCSFPPAQIVGSAAKMPHFVQCLAVLINEIPIPVVTFGLNLTDENGLSHGWLKLEQGYPGVFQVGVTVAGGQMTPVLTLLGMGLCRLSFELQCREPEPLQKDICGVLSAANAASYCADVWGMFHPVKTIEIVQHPGVDCKDDESGLRAVTAEGTTGRKVPNYFNYGGPAYESFTQCLLKDCDFAIVRKFCPHTCRLCVSLAACKDKDAEAVQTFNVTCPRALSIGLCTNPLSAAFAGETCPRSCGQCSLNVGDYFPIQPVVRLLDADGKGVSGLRVRAIAPGKEYGPARSPPSPNPPVPTPTRDRARLPNSASPILSQFSRLAAAPRRITPPTTSRSITPRCALSTPLKTSGCRFRLVSLPTR